LWSLSGRDTPRRACLPLIAPWVSRAYSACALILDSRGRISEPKSGLPISIPGLEKLEAERSAPAVSKHLGRDHLPLKRGIVTVAPFFPRPGPPRDQLRVAFGVSGPLPLPLCTRPLCRQLRSWPGHAARITGALFRGGGCWTAARKKRTQQAPVFSELGIIYPNTLKTGGKLLKLLDCTTTQ
jgi:hypothetical protein